MKLLCAEALWNEDISTKRPSYKSIIDLVSIETGCDISYFSFTTGKELENLLSIFKKKKYDIFYLASHMQEGNLISGLDGSLIDINECLNSVKDCVKNRVLHLAGCSSIYWPIYDTLIKNQSPKVLSGYTIDTDTTESSAMDLLYLVTLIHEGPKDIIKKLLERYPDLVHASGFYIATP